MCLRVAGLRRLLSTVPTKSASEALRAFSPPNPNFSLAARKAVVIPVPGKNGSTGSPRHAAWASSWAERVFATVSYSAQGHSLGAIGIRLTVTNIRSYTA
jgi:hypothetical protein